MKRIKAACIMQTLHFTLKDDLPHDLAVQGVRDEIAKYKAHLQNSRTLHQIISEQEQPDGSVLLEIKKQYNTAPVGAYLH